MGNRVRVEGLTFSVDSPAIETFRKAAFFFNIHEGEERKLLNRWLPTDMPIVEFGGGIGVVACLANRRLLRPELHTVVEANPGLLPILKRNRDLNGCKYQVLNNALAYDCESAEFHTDAHFLSGRLDASAGTVVSVPATSLKSLIDRSGFEQISVICDIEGTEIALVDREIETFRQHVRFLLVEVHPQFTGEEAVALMIKRLEKIGFVVEERFGSNLALSRA